MRDQIISNLGNHRELEQLFRSDEEEFKREFNEIYPQFENNLLANFWNERINYDELTAEKPDNSAELFLTIIASLLAGTIAKIPAYFSIDSEYFYPRYTGFIVFPLLTAYFILKSRLTLKTTIFIAASYIISLIYITLLPGNQGSDTLRLACIHLPLFLWSLSGLAFTGGKFNNYEGRLAFLKYNGDLTVMSALLLISGIIFTAITMSLFKLIDVDAEKYFEYVGVYGVSAIPIAGTYLIGKNPKIVNRISPVIAKVFSPIVLVTLVVYLIAMIITGKDPYNDREFLLHFNFLLVGVLVIILFAASGSPKRKENRSEILILLLLSAVTIVVNGIALSAIIFRISEWGITPNRLAVLGSNILVLTNLLIVAERLFQFVCRNKKISDVESSITHFLPVYTAWSMIVTFIFPVVFDFR